VPDNIIDSDRASPSLSEQLLDAIEERIVMGTYPPGTRLDDVELAKHFGVSRTPIREALIRLETMRIVEKTPRKGWVVTPISPQSLCEMFEFISELEALCGRFAAKRATPFQLQQLLTAHEACRDVSDPDDYYRANEQFHMALYRAAGNVYLFEQLSEMLRRAKPYRRLQLRAPERIRTSFAEHEAIVAAILANDAEAAMERLRDHVMLQGERFNNLVRSLNDMAKSGAGSRV